MNKRALVVGGFVFFGAIVFCSPQYKKLDPLLSGTVSARETTVAPGYGSVNNYSKDEDSESKVTIQAPKEKDLL